MRARSVPRGARSTGNVRPRLDLSRADVDTDELPSKGLTDVCCAAAFWLMPGGDPRRALHFATLNAGLRPTPRARALLARATAMCEQGPVT